MATFELEATDMGRSGSIPVLPPVGALPTPNGAADERVVLQAYLSELDVYYEAVKGFASQEPDEVMQQIAAFSARLCEIRARLQRSGSTLAAKLRTREVEPLMEQCDIQFRIASRLQAIREFDFKASGGGV